MRYTLVPRALAALLACLSMPQAAAQEFTLKVAHFLPTSSTNHAKLIAPWCEKIARESNNRLKCQIFPSMQLGGTPPQLFDQARDGVADIVWTLPGYNAGRFPIMEVFELPFMINSAESASKAAWAFYELHGVKEFDAVKPLAIHVHDTGVIHTRERQIRTLEDFRGLKLRAPTRMTNRMLAAFGATPVSMPVPALADALSKGVIDGAVIPWEVVPSVKVHEMVKYHAETDPGMPALYTAVFLFAMNKATYDKLPPELKKVIDNNSGLELSGRAGAIWDASAPAARKLALDRGNQINVIAATELTRWDRAARGLYGQWIADMNNRGLNGTQMMADARDLLARFQAKPAASAAPVSSTRKAEQKK
ncbi:MAG: TRAP transporter substrate-binding protein [Burkholderiales bacterium]|jgi:TRAP-type C4-dicarboxylate transport system substrate-binding protein|nr:TRAP transporter substrate-binding protein [Burkholderiales bacterium]